MSNAYTGAGRPISSDETGRETEKGRILSEFKKDAATVKQDLGHLKDDAVKMSSRAVDHAGDAVRYGTQSAAELARATGDTCKKYHGTVRQAVISRPTTSILIAMGAGVVVGRLLGMGRR